MYELFIEKQRQNDRKECSKWLYRPISNTRFSLKIGQPKLDCCDRCDKFQIRLKDPLLSHENRAEIEEEFQLHRIQG